MYAQIRLSDRTVVGTPGPLPYCIANWSDAEVADLDAMQLDPTFGLVGIGFWPVHVTTPAFDPTTQMLDGGAALGAPDPDTRTVPATANVRALTSAELAAALAEARAALPDISDRQCFQALADMGKVTQDEAVAAVSTGQMPKAVTDGIAQLPAAQQFPARMLLCGATTFHRTHPMVAIFGSFFGLSDTDLDALWRAAEVL